MRALASQFCLIGWVPLHDAGVTMVKPGTAVVSATTEGVSSGTLSGISFGGS